MELTNAFTVPVGIERAWEVLSDLEGIAPCMPGAQLTEVEGDEYRGSVKVKVGPITAQYKGTATVRESDAEARRMVVDAGGRDTRGQGSADAVITVTMRAESDSSTAVDVATDLTIKGKVAQFGRGMLADVSAKLLDQFVECLEGQLDEPSPAPAAVSDTDAGAPTDPDAASDAVDGGETAGSTTANADGDAAAANGAPAAPERPAVRKIDSPEAEAVDLLDTIGGDKAKQLVPAGIVAVVLLVLIGRWRSARRRR